MVEYYETLISKAYEYIGYFIFHEEVCTEE